MQLPRWALALADDNGCSGSANAALASVTSLPNLDERALVAGAQAGRRAAFEELVRRVDRDVLRLALSLMKRQAKDITVEAAYQFLKSGPVASLRFRHQSSLVEIGQRGHRGKGGVRAARATVIVGQG